MTPSKKTKQILSTITGILILVGIGIVIGSYIQMYRVKNSCVSESSFRIEHREYSCMPTNYWVP